MICRDASEAERGSSGILDTLKVDNTASGNGIDTSSRSSVAVRTDILRRRAGQRC